MILLLLSIFALSGGGDWIGNGASLSENRIMMAFENMESYLQASIADTQNPLPASERALIQKIHHSLINERLANPQMVQFRPHSDLFIIDGKVKVAVTGLKVGDPIFINRDLLQRFDADNKIVEFSLMESVSLLVHELGHHQGVLDHNYLDQLGALVAAKTRFQEHWMPMMGLEHNYIGAQYVTPAVPWLGPTSLHFMDSEKHWDVQAEFQKLPLCENDLAGSKMLNLTFWNLFWGRPKNGWITFHANLAYQCQLPNGEVIKRMSERTKIAVEYKTHQQKFYFGFEQKQIRIEDCSHSGQFCGETHEAIHREFLKNQSIQGGNQ